MTLAQKAKKEADIPNYIKQGVEKTRHIKSFPAIKHFLEKGFAAKKGVFSGRYRKRYEELLQRFKLDLRRMLTAEEMEQLLHVDYKVPPEGVLVFVPGFEKPVLALNAERFPDFSQPGWVSHATHPKGLAKISKDGFLRSPIDQILTKKRYFTGKRTVLERRIVDGISFSLQDYKQYLGYRNPDRGDTERGQGTGGFFIFPIRNVLKEGLILDMQDVMDAYTEVEIKLVDVAYAEMTGNEVSHILYAINDLRDMQADVDGGWRFFNQCKKNIALLEKLHDELPEGEYVHDEKRGDEIFFSTKSLYLGDVDAYQMACKRIGVEPFEEGVPENELERRRKLITRAKAEIVEEHYRKNCVFSGKGEFYERLTKLHGSKESLGNVIDLLKKDQFILFYLFSRGKAYYAEHLLPGFTRPKGAELEHLNLTIFRQEPYGYVDVGAENPNLIVQHALFLSYAHLNAHRFMSKSQVSLQDYIDSILAMRARELKKLMKATTGFLIDALKSTVDKRFKTRHPCNLNPADGVLFLTDRFKKQETLDRLVSKGVPVFAHLPGQIIEDENKNLDRFFTEVFHLSDIPAVKQLRKAGSYFYLKNGKVLAHQRTDGKETVIG